MRKDSGVIGVEVLVGVLLGSLISFFATQNHTMDSKIKELKKQNKQLINGVVACNKEKKDIADYIRLFISDYGDNK